MGHSMRDGFGDDAKGDAPDELGRSRGSEASDDSLEIVGSQPSEDLLDIRSSSGFSGVSSGRIVGVIRDGPESDSLLSRQVENEIFLWLQALDIQFMGGCRSDERLKPLLKLDATSGAAEDQFMTQLVQHFEASEVAVLARCLCLPLVSVRVGKITKQGSMLYPSTSRGFLSLTLLPSSHMRLSFTGDDGCTERLAVVSDDLESSSVIIEVLSADTSGRSFLLKLSDSQILFLWCSEKSKADGMELIEKMKDLLGNKPSLSVLTGISKSRLDSFASHLRDYMLASTSTPTAAFTSSSGSLISASNFHSELGLSSQSRRPSHARIPAAHASKVHSIYQTGLSPRSNAFKDGTLRNSTTRNGVREKVRSRGDSSISIQADTAPPVSSCDQSMIRKGKGKIESHGSNGLMLPMLSPLSSPLFSLCPTFTIPSKFSNQSSLFSPYYCWCPPCPTPLQHSTTSHLPSTSELLPLPPLSTLLSSAAQPEALVTSRYLLDVAELPPRKLPTLLSDPLVHLSMPVVASLCPLPSSQQIATFTPYMSDPIVHIPMIDVCSLGQGYLVNACPSMPAVVPPLPISRANHLLVPSSESLAEKNARDTLRMLMASAPALTAPKLFNVFPEVLGSMELCGVGGSVSGKAAPFKPSVSSESIDCDASSLKLPSSSGEVGHVDAVIDECIEECNCRDRNSCRRSTETDEV